MPKTKSQPKNWRKVMIKDFGRVVTGKTPPTKNQEYYGHEYPFITPTDISDDSIFVEKPERYLSEEGAKKIASSKLPSDAVCYTCIASVGKIAITKEASFTNQQINSVIVDHEKADYRYVFYLLKNITPQIKGMVGGAASPIINKTAFENIDVDVFDLPTQKQIADILSTYDNLIENNTRRIKILEEMAQAIYKEWFVYFRFPRHEKVRMIDSKTEFGKIPKRWEVKSILAAEYFSFIKENVEKFNGKKIYYATADVDGITISGKGEDITFENKPSRAQKKPTIFSVWFARMKDTYKVLGFTESNQDIAENSILSSGFAGFVSKKLAFPFLYYSINSERFHEMKDLYCTGATQMSLTNDGLEKILILVPPIDIVLTYGEIILSNTDEIFLLQKHNIVLRQARDLLLPKLVTGEIEVK